MGGTPENQEKSAPFTVQEKGEIYFFYKPKIDVEKPQSLDDVQRMFFVLRPQAAETPVEEKQSSEAGKEGQLKVAHDKEESTPADLKKPDAENKEEETKAEGDDGSVEVKPQDTPGEEKNDHKSENAAKTEESPGEEKNGTKTENATKTEESAGEENNSTKTDNTTKTEEGEDIEKIEIGEKPLFRYIVMGRKSLPDVDKGKSRPYWGYVELVTTSAGDLKKVLCEEEYDTATLGHRVNPAARPVGEGRYSLVQHRNGNRQPSSHLVYKLEHPGPHKRHDPQDAMNIEPQASFVIQVKNPKQPTPATANTANTGNKRPALLPAHLLGGMGARRFVPLDPPDLLNYEGVELLLISTHDELLDSEVDAELETSDSLSAEAPDLMELVVSSKDHTKLIRPLFEGTWE